MGPWKNEICIKRLHAAHEDREDMQDQRISFM